MVYNVYYKFDNKALKSSKIRKNKERKSSKRALIISEEQIKCNYQLPKVHMNCPTKTFSSTFLVQLLERFCCSYMPLYLTLKQCLVKALDEDYVTHNFDLSLC